MASDLVVFSATRLTLSQIVEQADALWQSGGSLLVVAHWLPK
jgi:hypothetical protein